MLPALVALTIAAACADGAANASPRDWPRVAALVSTHCTPCHRAGGGAPFALRDERDLVRRAATLVLALDDRRMPPWSIAACAGTPRGAELALGDADRAALRAWLVAQAGRVVETDDARPIAVAAAADAGAPSREGARTLVLEAAEAFAVPAEGFEVLRTFVLPFALQAPAAVRRVRVLPDPPELARQAFLLVDETGTGAMMDEADPGGGYEAPADMGLDFAGAFGGWRLGLPAAALPDDLARPLPAHGALLVGFHLHPIGRSVPFRVRVELELADAPTRPVRAVPIGDLRVDVPAGAPGHEIAAEWVVPFDAELVEITPHGGRLCRTFRLDAIGAGHDGPPIVRALLEIDPWDPAWHASVPLQAPLPLAAGTRVRAAWRYDNTAENPWNPHDPPRVAGLGHAPGDETPVVLLHLAPRDPANAEALAAAQREAALALMHARQAWLRERR